MKNPETLEKLCEIVEQQLEKAVRELENDPGKLPMQDAEYLDKLTHMMKSVKTTMAMEGYGSSERRGRSRYTGRYVSRDGGSYDGSYEGSYDGSYEGGSRRGSYYGSRRSMHGDPREEIRTMMEQTDDERVRKALEKAMREI